jgi:hypothetical protein
VFIGHGDGGEDDFPLTLEQGDWIVLVQAQSATPKWTWAVIDRRYEHADTATYGVTKLYAGVDSPSNILAATAGAVKTAYDLADTKEPAIGTKGSAFNKNFGGTGSSTDVARRDHYHSTFDRASAVLSGANVFSNIVVTDGIVTAISTRALTLANLGFTGAANANYYQHPDFNETNISATGQQVIRAITINNGHIQGFTVGDMVITDLGGGPIDDGVAGGAVVWSGAHLDGRFSAVESNAQAGINNAALAAKEGIKFYDSVALADAGGHNENDIVIVLES